MLSQMWTCVDQSEYFPLGSSLHFNVSWLSKINSFWEITGVKGQLGGIENTIQIWKRNSLCSEANNRDQINTQQWIDFRLVKQYIQHLIYWTTQSNSENLLRHGHMTRNNVACAMPTCVCRLYLTHVTIVPDLPTNVVAVICIVWIASRGWYPWVTNSNAGSLQLLRLCFWQSVAFFCSSYPLKTSKSRQSLW